ncbi:MAG: DNA replication terminus site-binding protein [Halomonas sp.]|nr:DNA replication terminus site-binding protein [Halomonas sp.]
MDRPGNDNVPSRPAYQLLAELDEGFDRIIACARQVVDRWQRSCLPAWSFDRQTADADWLRQALLDLWYVDGQDGRVTRSYIGLVAADPATCEAAQALNQAKAAFSELLSVIRQQSPQLIPEIKARLPVRHPELNDHLGGAGLARLHLKQTWRALPIAEAPVERVRLAWYASGRSITRLSVAEVERKLMAFDTESPHIRIQLERLAGIPSSEPLAQVQRQAPLMRANLFYQAPLPDGRLRRAMNAALPLLVPQAQLPHHNLPPAEPPSERQRARRSDERLEDTPFLPSLRVFRYR